MEIGIAGVDALYPVFSHERGRVGIMKNVAAQMRHLGHDFSQDG